MRMRRLIIAAVLAALGVAAVLATAMAGTGPLRWQGYTWCPTAGTGSGCNAVYSHTAFGNGDLADFYPAQVSVDRSGYLHLAMNSTGTESGAVTSQTQETFTVPFTLSSKIELACSGGLLDNWPAFWLTSGSLANGEIDVVEGLHGVPRWTYHYTNAQGTVTSQTGSLPGFTGCGTFIYKVVATTSSITWYFGGTKAGEVATSCSAPCISIGVPISTSPMNLLWDYANGSTEGGPGVNSVNMQVQSLVKG